jgi:hypothetical protein
MWNVKAAKDNPKNNNDENQPTQKPQAMVGKIVSLSDSIFLELCQKRHKEEIIRQVSNDVNINAIITSIMNNGTMYIQTAIASVLLGEFLENISNPLEQKINRKKTFEILEVLFDAGVNPNQGNTTTLNIISNLGDGKEVLVFLSSRGMAIENDQEFTDVMESIVNGNIEKLKELHAMGLDMNKKSMDGNIPIYEALYLKAPLPVRILAVSGEARSRQWAEYLSLLKNLGIDIFCKDKFGMNLLQMALGTDQADLALGLVYTGHNINECCNEIDLPICIAAIQCDLDTVKRLINAGADYYKLKDIPRRLLDKETYTFSQLFFNDLENNLNGKCFH